MNKLMKFLFLASLSTGSVAGTIPDVPLDVNKSAKPMTMIVSGRDHKMFYEAYNDASDLNEDGQIDIRFNPDITYLGLFDSNLCYNYNSDKKRFVPKSVAVNGVCNGRWSGNWLNYVTTSRIDALRVVLYGGYRVTDNKTKTVLRRAYIPQDAHSWAKEYTSVSVDGYDISDYTPLSPPNGGRHHLFGNLTPVAWTNCSDIDDCSDNKDPLLSVVTNTRKRVWEWASKESPVLDGSHGGTRNNYVVQVLVCTPNFHDGCKQYPEGNYKPVGLLHEYGEDEAMLFGLLTGSYNKNTSGGVLRKVVSSFADEIDPDYGRFKSGAKIVNTFDALRIRGYNNGRAAKSYAPFWSGAWITTRAMREGEFVDWGNPIGEMMYEAVRYFAGKKTPTPDFYTTGGEDDDIGLTAVSWDDPYDNRSKAKAPYCSKPNMLVVSDINPSYDSDQLPGSYFGPGLSGDLSGLNVTALANEITSGESNVTGLRFIGQSGGTYDGAPTPKNVSSLGTVRGLAPEEPTKLGSYYSASIAYYGKKTDISDATDDQKIDSYFVALASPLPKLDFPMPDGKVISMVPFAKSVGGCLGIHPTNSFIPTNQIVDYYITQIVNVPGAPSDPNVNGGRPYVKFAINFEDVEQAADHDMDAIALYEVYLRDNGKLRVKVEATYASGCIIQHLGYVMSGTTADGTYLVVRDSDTSTGGDVDYVLDVPNTGAALPLVSERDFETGNSNATFLRNPLWYAAKWGGFVDSNGNDVPDLQEEWDADNDGVPDTYFLVKNPTKLKEALAKAFDEIVNRGTRSASNVTVNSASIRNDSLVFQALYKTDKWRGDLVAYPLTNTGVSTTASWKAADMIPSPASRKLYTTNSDGNLVEFKWSFMTSTDKADMDNDSDILSYIRGDRSGEKQNGGSFRDRSDTVLGDIVHSSPVYVSDIDTVFAGSNDGMLHAFNASTGEELMGYIPGALIPELKKLTDPDLSHVYMVDGDIAVTSRADTGGDNLLVATLGRGGKGLFGMNVTNPASPTDVWEYTNSSDNNLGYMLGKPIIASMNNGEKAVIVGNGYNSDSGSAVLYIFKLDDGSLITTIDTGVGGGNGMSTPTAYDDNDDGTVDYIYAGDLKGNVWKFDVSSSSVSAWDSVYSSGGSPAPLFTAINGNGDVQPITAPILTAVNDQVSDSNYGKRYVFFGTGQYMFIDDPADQTEQSWYALIDDNAVISGRVELKQRSLVSDSTTGGYDTRAFDTASANDMSGYKGWYLDWTYPTPQGERVVTSSKLWNLVEPTLVVSSIIPVSDPCLPGGTGFINFINPFTGGALTNPIIDVDNDGSFDDVGSLDPDIGMPGEPVLVGDTMVVGGTSAEIVSFKLNMGSSLKGRLMWREIVN